MLEDNVDEANVLEVRNWLEVTDDSEVVDVGHSCGSVG